MWWETIHTATPLRLEAAVSPSGSWPSGTGGRDGERAPEGEETCRAGTSPASALRFGRRPRLAGSLSEFLSWLKHPCFVSRLPSCSDALPVWAEMWGTWRAMSGLSPPPPSWRQTGGAPSFPPSLHVLVTNCCQPHFAQYQQFSHLSIHQTRLEGLLILRYLGPTCLSLLFVGLE